MDRTIYKRLGDYIRSVDVRNCDLAITNLLGVSISKTFIPSIANTIGTDMSTYKIVEPYQFAYGPVTSRNGDKITIALYKGSEKCIISQAYETFEIIDKELLDPDYLMMWALRPEFDRYARFMSHGSAREIFSWEEMCNVYLPIPDIELQRSIVRQYSSTKDRISIIDNSISILEDTCKTLYRQLFLSNIDLNNLPDGWKKGSLKDIACEQSQRISKEHRESYPVYLPIDCIPRKTLVYSDTRSVSEAESSLVTFKEGDVIIGAIRPYFHKVVVARSSGITRSTCLVVNTKQKSFLGYITMLLFDDSTIQYATANSIGTTMPYITWDILSNMECVIPDETTAQRFNNYFYRIYSHLSNLIDERKALYELLELLPQKL